MCLFLCVCSLGFRSVYRLSVSVDPIRWCALIWSYRTEKRIGRALSLAPVRAPPLFYRLARPLTTNRSERDSLHLVYPLLLYKTGGRGERDPREPRELVRVCVCVCVLRLQIHIQTLLDGNPDSVFGHRFVERGRPTFVSSSTLFVIRDNKHLIHPSLAYRRSLLLLWSNSLSKLSVGK